MHFSIATSDWVRQDCFVVLQAGLFVVCTWSFSISFTLLFLFFSFAPLLPHTLLKRISTQNTKRPTFDLVSFFHNYTKENTQRPCYILDHYDLYYYHTILLYYILNVSTNVHPYHEVNTTKEALLESIKK